MSAQILFHQRLRKILGGLCRSTFVALVSPIASLLGFTLVERFQQEQTRSDLSAWGVLESERVSRALRSSAKHETSYSIVIFSRDRALQLHALLRSMFHNLEGFSSVDVQFSTSNEHHQAAYDELILEFEDLDIRFVNETEAGFYGCLCDILENCKSNRILFLVDDIIFTRSFDLARFDSFDLCTYVPSLRLGTQLTYSYAVDRLQPLPPFHAGTASSNDLVVWRWAQGECDWRYPLSLDGNIYDLGEIKVMVHQQEFSSPNHFEDTIQAYRQPFLHRYGVANIESVLFNAPLNRVQTTHLNRSEDIPPAQLLEYWNEGRRIDVRQYEEIEVSSVHMPVELSLTVS